MLADDLLDGDLFVGRTHPGMISYEFLESHGITISAVKPMPLQIAAGARLTARDADRRYDYWGVSNVEIMKRARTRMVILYAIGLTPPRGELSLPRGEEQPRLRLDVNADLSVYYQRTQHLLDSILDRSGCTRLRAEMLDPEGTPYDELHFFSAHHVGSCRMADSASRGVVDARGEAFLYPGLYVSDGASIPSSLAVNSSLTILANAERIAAGIVERHGGRAIALARGQTEGGSPEGGNARSLYP
jgi:choline dehydrogenase-like flavoprotein